MNTTIVIRVCIFALVILAIVMGWNQLAKGEDNMGEMLIFMLVVGVGGGLLAVKYLIPWIGDALGTFFFSSGEEVKMDDSLRAAAKVAQGDYHGAIAEYEKAAKEKPEDAFPIAEIAKIHSEKLGDPHHALSFLQARLEGKAWEEDAAAFLMFRMVEIKVDKLNDLQGAHDLLEQVVANFPNTRHSANAHHKLQEVEQAQYKAAMEQRRKQSAQNG